MLRDTRVCLLVIFFVRHALCSEVVWPDQRCMNEAVPKCSDELVRVKPHALLQSQSLRQSLKIVQMPHLPEQSNAHSALPLVADLPHSTAEKHLEYGIALAPTVGASASPVDTELPTELHLPNAMEALMQTPEGLAAANRSSMQSAPGDVFVDTWAPRSEHAEVSAVDNGTTEQTSSHTLFTKVHARPDALSADWSWTSVMVILPCLLIGCPLIWAWWQLPEVIKDEGGINDEIWTAHDENLREIDISSVGASGVALLRRHSDRQFGILLSFVGIMLQIVFLYFIAVYSIQGAGKSALVEESKTPPPLMFSSLFCNSMTCFASFITGMKTWDTSAPPGYEVLHRALVMLDSFIIPSIAVVVGSMYLCTSRTISALVFNATSMAFVCQINMQIAGLMGWSLSAHGGRAFQPGRVCIKDSVNTMQYAYYSLIGSALIALALIPVAIADYF